MNTSGVAGTVYLLHFEQPLTSTGQQHYTGWTKNLPNRLFDHRHNGSASSGVARLARRQGVSFALALIVSPATQADERAVKSLGAKRLCPLCKGGDPSLLAAALSHGAVIQALPDVRAATRAERFGGARL